MTLEQLRQSGLTDGGHHHLNLWEANELIAKGVPADVVFSATQLHVSGERTIWHWKGEPVEACIGVAHYSLIYALGEYFGVDPDVGRRLNGRGFAMRAVIEVLEKMIMTGQ